MPYDMSLTTIFLIGLNIVLTGLLLWIRNPDAELDAFWELHPDAIASDGKRGDPRKRR